MNETSERIEKDFGPVTEERVEEPGQGTAPSGVPEADGGQNGQAALTKDDVLEALKSVIDPELGINIVDLGLVYDVDISEGNVHVTYTLTTMGCPIGPLVEAQMHQLIDPMPGIDSFEAEMVLRPPWSPEMMSEEAKEALGVF